MIPDVKIGDKLVCPVCGKKFTATEDTKCAVREGFTCNWECFLKRVREVEDAKK